MYSDFNNGQHHKADYRNLDMRYLTYLTYYFVPFDFEDNMTLSEHGFCMLVVMHRYGVPSRKELL